MAVLVMLRAIHLHIFEGDFLKGEGQKRFLRLEKLPAYRGMILDRNGRTLAVSTPARPIDFLILMKVSITLAE